MIHIHRMFIKHFLTQSYQTSKCMASTTKLSSSISFIKAQQSRQPNYSNKYLFSSEEKKKQQSTTQKQSHTFDQNSSYFDILGISSNCTEEQIKFAYLEMVKKYHPDLSKQENASQKFQLIQKAYQILSDPQQRSKHRQTINIPNPQVYKAADQIKQKFKNFKRKDRVPDEWQFSHKLFKKHYEQVDAKQKEYTKFHGQDNEYWVHKSEMMPDRKVYIQQVAMVLGSVGIAVVALYYMWS